MKYLAFLASLSIALLTPLYSFSEPCKTDRESMWLCFGDRAWVTGYLVVPSSMEELVKRSTLLDEVIVQRDGYKSLLEESQGNEKSYLKIVDDLKLVLESTEKLRDEYKSDLDEKEEEMEVLSVQYNKLVDDHNQLIRDSEDDWSGLEVGLLTSGVSVASILVGVGVYALVSD